MRELYYILKENINIFPKYVLNEILYDPTTFVSEIYCFKFHRHTKYFDYMFSVSSIYIERLVH
jgi:hypothetical protein